MSDLPTDAAQGQSALSVEWLNELADAALDIATKMLMKTGRVPMFFVLEGMGPSDSTLVFVDDLGLPAVLGHPAVAATIRSMIKETGALAVLHVADTWVTTMELTDYEQAQFKRRKELRGESFEQAFERTKRIGRRRECLVCAVQSPIYLRICQQFYRRENDKDQEMARIVLEEKHTADSAHDNLTGGGRFQFFHQPSDENPN